MAGKILLVTKLKGGSGATTTCRELAAAAVDHGLTVSLIDLDAQGGLTAWWNRRTRSLATEGHATVNPRMLQIAADDVPLRAGRLRDRFDLVIIDSPPSVHTTIKIVAAAVDLALIPARPTVDDLDAVGPIVRLLRGSVDVSFVLTQVPGGRRSRDGHEALAHLAKLGPVVGMTSSRLDYPRPAGFGRTGYEDGGAAREEIAELWAATGHILAFPSRQADVVASAAPPLASSPPDHVMTVDNGDWTTS